MFQPSVPIPELILRVVLVYAGVFILLRIVGKRHVGELAPFDLVVLLLLSECVQNALIGDDKSVTGGLIAAATFAGIVLTFAIQPAVKFTLPFSAGVTLYVAASDLIPEVNRKSHKEVDLRASLLVFAGVALFYLGRMMLRGALD